MVVEPQMSFCFLPSGLKGTKVQIANWNVSFFLLLWFSTEGVAEGGGGLWERRRGRGESGEQEEEGRIQKKKEEE